MAQLLCRIFVAFPILFYANILFAGSVASDCKSNNTVFSINNISYLIDTTNQMTFDSAYLQYQKRFFTKHLNGIPNFGFTHASIWLCTEFIPPLKREQQWFLEIPIPGLHFVDFYIVNNDTLTNRGNAGFALNTLSRASPFRNPSIAFTSSANDSQLIIFIRVKSQNPIITPMSIRSQDNYISYDRNREFLLGFYFGILAIMALYHLFIFFSTREISYLWLVLFTVAFGIGQMTAVYGFLSYLGSLIPEKTLRWLHVINYLAAYAGIQLSRDMVQPNIYAPRCNLMLQILQYFPLILVPLSPFMSFMTAEKLLLLPNLLPLPFLVFTGVVALRKGHRTALFYLLATTSFISGLAVYNLMYGFNLFPFNELTYFIPNITFVIMLLLFSFGIADKINILKREEAKAREQALFELGEKLKVQDEKALVERELEQSRKMEAIGRLLSGIAHDMKNFLSPILGYAVLIRKQTKNDAGITDTSEKLVTATQKLNDLAMTLVNVSRKNAPGTEPLSINNLISQTASLLKHSSPSHIEIEIQLSPKDYSISANPGMLHSALLNLGVNAIDAMPNGGKVTITGSTESLDTNHPACSKFGINGGTFTAITVRDTGTGIDSCDLDYIFEPFFTKNKSGKGTGLGLTGVYNCVKVHGGCLEVQSEVHKGTTFRLYFPLREEDNASGKSLY